MAIPVAREIVGGGPTVFGPTVVASCVVDDYMYDNSNVVLCWRYGNMTLCFAAIDATFCIVNMMFVNTAFVLSFMPIVSGYLGAKKFIPCATLLYLVYCVLLSGLRVMYLVQYSLGDDGRVADASYAVDRPAVYAIMVVGVLVQCYIGYVVRQFYVCLTSLTYNEQLQLQIYRMHGYMPEDRSGS